MRAKMRILLLDDWESQREKFSALGSMTFTWWDSAASETLFVNTL